MNEVREYSGLNLYQGVRGLAIKILNRVDRTDAYLDKLLEIELKHSEFEGPDKALLFEIVHGVIRWLGRIDWILNGFYRGQFSKCIPNVKNAMRVALYQILFLDRVPHHAAVNEAVEFVKKLQGQKPADLTNAVLRNIIRNKDGIRYPNSEEDKRGYFSAYYSHPSWLVKRWVKRYGEDFTEKLLIANNEKPTLVLRVNGLKTNLNELKRLLNEVGLKFTEAQYLKNFIKLNNLTNIAAWDKFKEGYFSIQDESTGFSCRLLEPKPGMRVLDLCAAPGGKTGMIADLMKNEGEIVAIDRFESRAKILEKNLDRLGVKNVRIEIIDANEFEGEAFDRVLVDAPCSGIGTLTKKPDIKWKRDLGDIRKLSEIQYQLFEKGASLLKPNGILVYSTCTIEPEENIEVVKRFLSNHNNFSLVSAKEEFDASVIDSNGCVQTMPNVNGIDGAFAAKIVRNS